MSRGLYTLIVAVQCLLTVTFTNTSYGGDNRGYNCGPNLTPSYSGSSPHCCPIQKVPVTQGIPPRPSCGAPAGPSDRLVPLTYVEPGPIRAIAFYAVGLLKSTIAAPFRLIEAVIPVGGKPDCRPPKPVIAGCAPPAPHLGPRPGPSCQPSCGPNLPPQVVKEYEFPPLESDNLLSGLWNFPATLVRQGRFTGDVFRNDPCAPVRCSR